MRFLFPIILIFLLLFRYALKSGDRKMHDADREFWERESKANSVRKKDIEHLHYITIPKNLPTIDSDNSKIQELLSKLESMRQVRILNLTGLSNTDLKLEYGVANLEKLSSYDENFTELAKTLATLSHLLIEENLINEATFFLEFGIECNSDITSNYLDLAKIYKDLNQPEKINELIKKAEGLNSLSKNIIISKLQAL